MSIGELRVCELRERKSLGISRCMEPIECLTLRKGKPCGWFKHLSEIIIEPRPKQYINRWPARGVIN